MKKLYSLSLLLTLSLLVSTQLAGQVNITNGSTTVCSDTLYDSGGLNGNYGNNENLVYTINQPNVDSLDLIIDSVSMATGDTLFFFDGADTNATLIYMFNDTSIINSGTITSNTGIITIQLKTDGSITDYGFRLEWYGEYQTFFSTVTAATLNVCQNDMVNVSAAITGGGGVTDYQWYYNTTTVGTNTNSYTATILADQDSVWVFATDSICPYYEDSAIAEVFNVTLNTNVSVSIAKDDPNVCQGDNVTFTATPTNGGGSPVYTWTVGGDTAQTGASATYMTDSLVDGDQVIGFMASSLTTGCLIDSLSSDTLDISVGDTLSATVTVSGDPSICSGDINTFTVSYTNGGSPPNFLWFLNDVSTAVTDSIYTNNTLSDADEVKIRIASSIGTGCLIDSLVTDSIVVNVNALPTATLSFTQDVLCNPDSTGYLVVTGSGGNVAADYVYQWDDYASQTTDTAFNLPAGTYQAVVIDDSLCTDTTTGTVTQPTLLGAAPSGVNILCFSDSTGSATANETGGTGPYTFAWNDYASQTTGTASNLPVGTYTVVVTDNNLCTYTDSVTLTEPTDLVVGATAYDALCNSDSSGSVASSVSGGVGPYTYAWDDYASQTVDSAIVLPAGTYKVIVTDNNLCQDSASATVNEPTALTGPTSGLDIPCFGDSTGSATVTAGGGTPPYTYAWDDYASQTTATASTLPIGTYNVVVTDNNLCTFNGIGVTLTQNPDILTSTSGVNILCNPDSTGIAIVTASGGFGALTFQWDDYLSQTNDSAVNLPAGTYNVVVTDDTLCTANDQIILTQPAVLGATFNEYPTTTFGGSDGALRALPFGGVSPYTHVWQNTVTNDSIFGLATGYYTDTIRDANLCKYIDSGFVAQPDTFYPGDILIGGLTSAKICDGATVGMIVEDPLNPSVGGQFGPGAHQFQWEFSKDLLTWNPLPGTNDEQDYNFNDTILSNTFVRRRVSDSGSTVDYTNTVFLQYIADQNIIIGGLASSYCENSDSTQLFPSPTSPGTGAFTSSAWMNPSNDYFIPANAAASAPGTSNDISYTYTDQFGCVSSDTVSTIVYTTDPGVVSIPQNIFTPNDAPVILSSTYPAGGTFNGVGVYFSTGSWRFNPALVDPSQYNQDLDIAFQYFNATTNCTSYDTLTVQVVPASFTLTTNPGNTTEFLACYTEDTSYIHVLFSSDSITQYSILVTNNATSDTATLVSGSGGFTGDFTIPFNPKMMRPVAGGGSLGATALLLNDLNITFFFTSVGVPAGSNVSRDMELMNLGNVSITGPTNSVGTTGPPFQYCEYVDQVTFTGNFNALPGRSTQEIFQKFPLPAGGEFTDNGDATADFHPDSVAPASNHALIFQYIDDSTQCAISDTNVIRVSAKPTVSISGIDTAYCYNDPAFVFTGSPASPGPSRPSYFLADPALTFSPNPRFMSLIGQNSASYTPVIGDIGDDYFMRYVYASDTTGCVDSAEAVFDVTNIPTLAIERKDLLPFVHCVDGDTVIYVKKINGLVDKSPASTMTGTGMLIDSVFVPSIVGPNTDSYITYTATDSIGCSNTIQDTITVLDVADAGFSISSNQGCQDSTLTLTLTPNQKNINSYFLFDGTDTIKGNEYGTSLIIPLDTNILSVGANVISYTYDDGTGCVATTDTTVTIFALPTVYFIDTLGKFQQGDICYNDGSPLVQVFPSSLDSNTSFISTNVSGLNGYKIPNGLNSFTVPINVTQVGNKFLTYSHTDINGCTNIATQNFEVHDIPQLSVNFEEPFPDNNPSAGPDSVVCAIYDNVILRGDVDFELNPTITDGVFLPSAYGALNSLLDSISDGRYEYGSVPLDLSFIDTVYFEYTDPVFGCYNRTSQDMYIRRRPPAAFWIDSSTISKGTLCPDGQLETNSLLDSSACVGCNAEWNHIAVPSNLSRVWTINTVGSSSPTGTILPAVEAAPLNYRTPPFPPSGPFNKFAQTVTVVDASNLGLGCASSDTQLVVIDTLPVVSLFIEPIYCSNDNSIRVSAFPPSGSDVQSYFSSSNMEFQNPPATGFTDTVPAGDSVLFLDGNNIVEQTIITTYNLSYTYIDDITACNNDITSSIRINSAPNVRFESNAPDNFCNYDDPIAIGVEPYVGQSGYLRGAVDTVWSTKGAVSSQVNPSNGGRFEYWPGGSFLGDPNFKFDEIFFKHTDTVGCNDTVSLIIKNDPSPQFRWFTGGSSSNKDSVCFEAGNFNLFVERLDTNSATWNFVGVTAGTNYFQLGDSTNPGSWRNLDLGPGSNLFDPEKDSERDTNNVITNVHFIGEYATSSACRDTISYSVVTRPTPVAHFMPNSFCQKFEAIFDANSSSVDRSISNDDIGSYYWTVDGRAVAPDPLDTNKQNDTLFDIYNAGILNPGNHLISLKVKSNKGCESESYTIAEAWIESPIANFDWNMSDECDGETVAFNQQSLLLPSDPNDRVYSWDFGDNQTDTVENPTNDYAQPGRYIVTLEVGDPSAGCSDTIRKEITIRSIINSFPFVDGFEDTISSEWAAYVVPNEFILEQGNEPDLLPASVQGRYRLYGPKYDYIHAGDSASIALNTLYSQVRGWEVGNMQFKNSSFGWSPANGSQAWYTYPDSNYANNGETHLISPCFDLSSMDFPMIEMELNYAFDGPNGDGAVLQMTTNKATNPESPAVSTGAENGWFNVGEYVEVNNQQIETGKNWYNNEIVLSNPGDQPAGLNTTGWSGETSSTKNQWVNSRYALKMDSVATQDNGVINGDLSYVRFRIAFKSGAEFNVAPGMGVDDFTVREREKNILLESFVNNNNDENTMDEYDGHVEYNPYLIDIQYNTAFPTSPVSSHSLNLDNNVDPAARVLYYSVANTPFVVGEGDQFEDNMSSYNRQTLKGRSVEDPKFKIDMTYDKTTDVLETFFVAEDPSFGANPVNVILNIALVEKSIANVSHGASGSRTYNNVLKKLYPDASGRTYNGMVTGDTGRVFTTVDPDVLNFYGNADDFKIIAFIQDKDSKEIYQAEFVDDGKLGTGETEYENLVSNGVEYNLYPNPTNGMTYMDFEQPLKEDVILQVMNQVGVVVMEERIPHGTQLHSFDLDNMNAGMYFIMLNNGDQKVAIKRLMLTR